MHADAESAPDVLIALDSNDAGALEAIDATESFDALGELGTYQRPQTAPLDSVAALATWQPRVKDFVAERPIAPRPPATVSSGWVTETQSAEVRIVHAHDMMGGYIARFDRDPQGGDEENVYAFSYWPYVDTFIYFGHHRINMPPPGWTISAHRNGVRVLGTISTGDADVSEIMALVASDDSGAHPLARILAEMAAAQGFDGWFFNIETPLPRGNPTCALCSGLGQLMVELRETMRSLNPDAEVIWYDSVTRTGELNWQNELNAANRYFFDSSDGLFTNYWWFDQGRPSPIFSASQAGARRYDVYTGIDVFGRGTYLGGGFDTWRALDAIAFAGTSAAIFAPGWTFERASAQDPFDSREARFWTGAGNSDCVPTDGVAKVVRPRPIPNEWPFVTHFDQGHGPWFFARGRMVSTTPWNDIAAVDVLPTWRRCVKASAGAQFSTGLAVDHPFDGASAWRIAAEAATSGAYLISPAYKAALPLERSVTVSYTVLSSGLDFALALILEDGGAFVLGPALAREQLEAMPLGEAFRPSVVAPTTTADVSGWETRSFELGPELMGHTLTAIGFIGYAPQGSAPPTRAAVHLGELRIEETHATPPVAVEAIGLDSVVWSQNGDDLDVGLTVVWNRTAEASAFDVYQISGPGDREPLWLGRSFTHRLSIAPGRVRPFAGDAFVRLTVRARGDEAPTEAVNVAVTLPWGPP